MARGEQPVTFLPASLRCEQAADNSQDRRLAGAVWAYEAGDLAGRHVKVETAQDVALAIAGDNATQLQACIPRSPAGGLGAPLRPAHAVFPLAAMSMGQS